MIRVDGVKNIDYKQNNEIKSVRRPIERDKVELSSKKVQSTNYSLVSKLKSIFAAIAIGLATQSCSEEDPINDIEEPQTGRVLDFSQALNHLRDNSDNFSTPIIIEKLDSTVYANKDKIDDFARKSDKNYQVTSEFVNTVLSAFGSDNTQFSILSKSFADIVDENDGLLNKDYVNRINELYEQINKKAVENPSYYENKGYYTDIYNKQDDLKTNCKAANSVRHSALRKLKNDAKEFDKMEPILTGDEYKSAYQNYISQIDSLEKAESLNTKVAEEKIEEIINTYNKINSIADANGKRHLYDAGLKMLNASHTMVDAASRVLIEAMEDATASDTPKFSESFDLIHNNLKKIINADDFESPIVDKIMDGLNL